MGSVLATGAASAGTNLLGDGGFERPALTGGAISRTFAVGQHIGAWVVTSGPVYVSAAIPSYETPPVGDQLITLRPVPGPADGEICQVASGLNPGSTYKIRFLAASILGESSIAVTFGGTTVGQADMPGTALPAAFTRYEWTVAAPASSASLCLRGHPISGGGTPLVDAVRIKPVG
jgi:hypothetical protein